MTTRPNALRLAEAIDPLTRYTLDNLTCSAAADELRRMHNEILVYHNDRLKLSNEVDRLRAALGLIAAVEQQPATATYTCGVCGVSMQMEKHEQQPADEPVACKHKRYSVDVKEQTGICYDCGVEGRMKFVVADTRPQPAAWVGLTDGEIGQILGFNQHTTEATRMTLICVAQAIEAKLREKNGGGV